MRLRITPASGLLLVVGIVVGWLWGQGRLAFLEPSGVGSRIGAALEEPDTTLRFEKLARALRGVNGANQAEAFAGFEAHQAGIEEPELDVTLHALTRVDPVAALERVQGWPPRGNRTYALRELFYAWARMDPGAALSAFEDHLLGSPDEFEIQRKLVSGWARSGDLRGATEYLASLESPVPRQELATEVAEARLKDGGVEAVIDWSESISSEAPEDLRRDVFAKAARLVALQDPQRAAEWVEGHVGEDATAGAIRAVGVKWAQEDPAAAFAWARGLPDHSERNMVVHHAFQRMLQRDPEAAEAWILEEDLTPDDDPVLTAYSTWLATDRPAEAVEWAERIEDEAVRQRALITIGRIWNRSDPEAVVAWLDGSGLSEETRRAVLRDPRAPRQRGPGLRPGPAAGAGAAAAGNGG